MALTSTFSRRVSVAVAGCLVAAAACVAWELFTPEEWEAPAEIRIGTAREGGAYLPIGNAFKPILEREFEGSSVSVHATGGSVANRLLLEDGLLELAILQSDVEPSDKVRIVRPLHDEFLQIVVNTDAIADAKSIVDLKGTRISAGPKGSGSRRLVMDLLTWYDVELELDDVASPAEEQRRLLAGEIAAICRVAGSPDNLIKEILEDDRMTLIPVEPGTDDKAPRRLDAFGGPNLFEPVELPNSYRRQPPGLWTVNVTALLVAHADLDDGFVYALAKLSKDDLAEMRKDKSVRVHLGELRPCEDDYSHPYHHGAKAFHEGQSVAHSDLLACLMRLGLAAVFAVLAVVLFTREFRRVRRMKAYERSVPKGDLDPSKPFDLFLSYSSRSKRARNAVRVIAEEFEPEVTCWYAPRNVAFGDEWTEGIANAIARTQQALVLMFTKEACRSKHIARELRLADKRDLRILPFWMEDAEPSVSDNKVIYTLAGLQRIDASGPRDVAIRALHDAVRRPASHEDLLPDPVILKRRSAPWMVGAAAVLLLALFPLWKPWTKDAVVEAPGPALTKPEREQLLLGQLIYEWAFEGQRPGVTYEVRRTNGRETATSERISVSAFEERALHGTIKWQVRAFVPGSDGEVVATAWSTPSRVEFYKDTLQKIRMRGEVVVAISDVVNRKREANPELRLIDLALNTDPNEKVLVLYESRSFADLSGLFKGDEAAEFDVMAARISIREDRVTGPNAWRVAFTDPLDQYPQAFVYLPDKQLCVGPNASGPCRVGVVEGTTNEAFMDELLAARKPEGAEVVTFTGRTHVYKRMYNALRAGELDLLTVDRPFAVQLQKEAAQKDDVTLAVSTVDQVLPSPPRDERIALAVKSADQRLRDRLDAALKEHRAEIDRMFDELQPRPMLID